MINFKKLNLKKYLLVLLTVGCVASVVNVEKSEKLDLSISEQEMAELSQIEAMENLIKERLSVAEELAEWKWHHKEPIDDPEGENAELKQFSALCSGLGLDPIVGEKFMKDLIDEARIIQIKKFSTLIDQNHHIKGNDYPKKEELLRKIDRIDARLATELAKVQQQR
ncbi:MAG: chorismate mutase [Simkaniaceae bacterium]|nr:chorismate mutase [Simkaniaceae bacterium]